MKTSRFVYLPVLATGIAGAFLLSMAAGPASASCGYKMSEHPLHGALPHEATSHSSSNSAMPELRTDWHDRTKHPLRGDFPYTAGSHSSSSSGMPEHRTDWHERTKHPLRGDFPYAVGSHHAKE